MVEKRDERIENLRALRKEDILRLLGSTPDERRVYLRTCPGRYFTVEDVCFDESKQQLSVSLGFTGKAAKGLKNIKKIIKLSKKEVE